MKTQFRIMAMIVGALVSGVVLASPSQPARSALSVNPGASTGTADLEFFADYISTSAVSAGAANGTANFNMVYN
ncbi:hypothetical protein R7V50_001604 [Raoultella ornithinolytica]|nr:hypothetical protein [Raoultella ornithinolytica]